MTAPDRVTFTLPDGDMAAWRWPNPGKPLLVFAHANGFNAGAYRQMLGHLAGRFEIIAPDLRGHGRTTLPADARTHRSWEIYATDLLALYDRLDRRPDLLAGHSMGAASTLLAAARMTAPPPLALVEPVVLPAPLYWAARSPVWPLFRARIKMGVQARARSNGWPDRETVLARYQTRPTFARWADGVLADYLEDGLTDTADGVSLSCDPYWEAANFEGQGHDLLAAARKIGGRARVLRAAHGTTVINVKGLARRGVLIDAIDAGHLVAMEQPEATAAWIAKVAD